jgi:hypothetical protein
MTLKAADGVTGDAAEVFVKENAERVHEAIVDGLEHVFTSTLLRSSSSTVRNSTSMSHLMMICHSFHRESSGVSDYIFVLTIIRAKWCVMGGNPCG